MATASAVEKHLRNKDESLSLRPHLGPRRDGSDWVGSEKNGPVDNSDMFSRCGAKLH